MQENLMQTQVAIVDETPEYNNHFENFRKNLVTLVAYLIDMPDEIFTGNNGFDIAEYENLFNHHTLILFLMPMSH